jgi:hypothetical protein
VILTEFISWCNENGGFVSLLLSLPTLLVSIIAIFVSIHTARLPYKKKVLVKAGHFISENRIGLHITVTNIGNRNIKIQTIGFLINDCVYINKNTLFDSQQILGQGETSSQYFDIYDLQDMLIKSKAPSSALIKAFVEDTEGTRYKENFSKVKTILNLNV